MLTVAATASTRHDQRIHHGIVEIVVGIADLVAEPGARHDQLGADHADEGIRDRELDAGEDIRRRVGQR